VNLSPARLAVLVALVVVGVAVLLNGFGDDAVFAGAGSESVQPSGSASPQPGGSPSATPSESAAPDLQPQVDGVTIQVLNGTTAVGLASQVDSFLTGKGYVQALPPGDLANKPAPRTIVYFRGGDDAEQNEVDAQHLATRFLKGVDARVTALNAELGSDVAPRTQLVVVLGTDYSEANPVT